MITEDLSKEQDILIIKFNPWRFKDEDTLILNFFTSISNSLDKELKNTKEKIGNFLKTYGSITSVFNVDLSKIGESLSDADIEQLKHRVNDFLKESNKKVVVIIDDIDRLDKQELFALFKLIKLTGDFTNTYYILSFDDEMVASSIGDRFAEGNKNSGHNFLEKIIQVPLRIPKAQTSDLTDYVFELINEVLKINEIDLKEEGSVLGLQVSQNFLLKINNPRLAIRYANSLSFLIPLLKGEVSIADLILFEGLKLFYPQHYDFIKKSPEFFIESYEKSYLRRSDTDKKEEFKNTLSLLDKDLTKKEQYAVKDLLRHLFPLVKEALDNYSYSNAYEMWLKEKRIASSKYFNRYFLYSIPKNEISDIYFEHYLGEIEHKAVEQVEKETSEFLKNIDESEFLSKISNYRSELNWEQKKAIIEVLCKFQNKFEGIKGGTFLLGYNPKTQLALTIVKLLENQENYEELNDFVKLLVQNIEFEFTFEIIRWLIASDKEYEHIIKNQDIYNLQELILDRALLNSKEAKSNLFEKYAYHIYRLLEYFHRKSPNELKKYIDSCFRNNKDFQEKLIENLTSIIYSSTYPEAYKTDFNQNNYDYLKKYYDVHKLYKIFSRKKYKNILSTDVKFFDHEIGNTKENAIRQFMHWYELDRTTGTIEAEVIE